MTSNTTSSYNKKNILYVTSTRADYGLMRDVLSTIDAEPLLTLNILACGMHMSSAYGNSIEDIKADGFNIIRSIRTLGDPDTLHGMAQSVGLSISGLSESFEVIKPDLILLEGDRGEALAAAVAASHMNIPVAHVSGGDVTGGMIVESIRRAITKFAHVHFPGTELSKARILTMGEEPWRVHMVGTPGTNVTKESRLTKEQISEALGLNLSGNLLLVLQHPVTDQISQSGTQMKNTLEAIRQLQIETVVIKSNSDAGSSAMSKMIDAYAHYNFIHIFQNLSRPQFIGVLSLTNVMIGNSSSGITEAPSFGIPVVNIGNRQSGRERGHNVVDVESTTEAILTTVKHLLTLQNDPIHKDNWYTSPYLDLGVAHKINRVLKEINLGPHLLRKQFNDAILKDISNI